jgi:YggT family protein
MSFASVAAVVDLVARALAIGLVVVAGAVAATHWAVRRRAIAPFSGWSRTVRNLSDPLLRPIERRLARTGGNPQDGTYWLLGLAVVAGLLLISGVRWLLGLIQTLVGLSAAGPRAWASVVIGWIFSILVAAIFIRVIASWFGVSQSSRWMRPVMWLTEWLIGPIRRLLPRTGFIDWSPLVAYLVLLLLRGLILR